MSIFVVSTVPADGLALVNAGTSADTKMDKSVSQEFNFKQTNKELLNINYPQVKLVDTNNHSLYTFYWQNWINMFLINLNAT